MQNVGHGYVTQNFKGLSPTNIKAELDFTLGKSAPLITAVVDQTK